MEDADAWLLTGSLEIERGKGDPFAAAIRGTRMPMVITDPRRPDNPIVFANNAFLRLTGYSRAEVNGRNCRFLQGPETDRAAVASIREAVEQSHDVNLEMLNYRKDGTSFWNALYISPVFSKDGTAQYFFASQLDVSDRNRAHLQVSHDRNQFATEVEKRTAELKEALAAKTLLLHEIDHRVKNNLQMISSLIILQSRRITDPAVRRSLMTMQERVEALSLVHRRLYQADDISLFDVGEFARDLSGELVAMSGRSDITVEYALDKIEVAADKAAPIALILNEVLVNALRHAFAAGRSGTIRVSLTLRSANFELEIVDNGVGITPTAAVPDTFGHTLVQALARQLRAKITWHEQNPGTRVHLAIPL